MLHDVSHSHSYMIGFQVNPLSHLPLLISSLYLHMRLSLFQSCLFLQKLAYNLYLHAQVSCEDTCLATLITEIRLNTLIIIFLTTSETDHLAYGLLI